MCDCVKAIEKKVMDRVEQQLESHNESYDEQSVSVRFRNRTYEVPGLTPSITIPVDIKYRRIKGSGEPYKNQTKDSVVIKPSFCPFCGESVEKDNRVNITVTQAVARD